MKKTSMMSCPLPEQRRFARVSLPMSAIVSYSGSSFEGHMARVRDINPLGSFLYCHLEAEVGQSLSIEFLFPDNVPVCCEGIVVRVEQGVDGASGIAIQFSRYDFPKSAAQRQPVNESKPFITWTLDLVEQMFEVRPDLRHCNAA